MSDPLYVGVIGGSTHQVGLLIADCARRNYHGLHTVIVGSDEPGAGRLSTARAEMLGVDYVECGSVFDSASFLVANLAGELWYFLPDKDRLYEKTNRDAVALAADRGVRCYRVSTDEDFARALNDAHSHRAAADRGGAGGHTVGGRG